MKGHFAAIVLIVVGSFFLLSNLGLLHISLAELFRTWWPAILIAVGVSLLLTPGGRRERDRGRRDGDATDNG